jgi:hypothetical protein
MKKVKRLTSAQTKLHSEGAEFLVLGQLLILGIHATKAYVNYPGWDVLALNPELNKSLKIQVKSRFASDSLGFLIKNLDFDYLVLVRLNRGNRYSGINPDSKKPQFWIIPKSDVQVAIQNPKTRSSLGVWRITHKHLPKPPEKYEDNWISIAKKLEVNIADNYEE